MGNKEKIFNLLQNKDMTTKEISQEINISENEARVYINRLKEKGRIKAVGKKERYKLYRIIEPIENQDKLKIYEEIIKKLVLSMKKYKPDIKFSEEEFKSIKELMEEI